VVKSCPGGEFKVGNQSGCIDGRPGAKHQWQLCRVHPCSGDKRCID
jgi:hypothetical protein